MSLTVSGLGHDWFEVSLIPTTLELTTLGRAEVGTPVNLEVDVIAKYVERLLAQQDALQQQLNPPGPAGNNRRPLVVHTERR